MDSPNAPSDPFTVLTGSLLLLAQHGELKRFRKGHRIIEEGESGDTLFIILAGKVRVFGSDEREREITYGNYGVGEYLGEISLDGGPRSASVEALEPCLCAVVTRQTLLAHIAEHPEFAFDLIAQVIRRVRAATTSAKQLALNDVYGRLVLTLNEMAATQPDGTRRIAERLTHQDIANRLGCSREMVSRLVKDLEAGGYLVVERGIYTLLQPLPAGW